VTVPAPHNDLSEWATEDGLDRFRVDLYRLANIAEEWAEPWTEEVAS
jgi:hypothetical protein